MSDAIEDSLNLPRLKDILEQIKVNEEQKNEVKEPPIPETAEAYSQYLLNTEKIENALANDNDHSFMEHDKDMDEIKETAMKTYTDLIDLGFNMDPKFAGDVFGAAVQLLKLAGDSSTAKIERRLRVLKLSLDKRRLDQLEPSKEGVIENESSVFIDRNEILKRLGESKQNDQSAK